MRAGLPLRLAACALLPSCFGCATWGAYLDPQPTPEGRTEASVRVETAAVRRGTGYFVLPSLAFGFRHGIAEDIDLGAYVSGLGIGGDMRLALSTSTTLPVSLVPAVDLAWAPLTNDEEATLRAAVRLGGLVGLRLSSHVLVIAGARPALLITGANTVVRGRFESVRTALLLGGLVAVRLELPGDAALVVEGGAAPEYDLADGRWRRPAIHGGAALRFRDSAR